MQIPTVLTLKVPNDEDEYINSIEDEKTRRELRWCKYLERLRSTAWGDHIAVQGLADMNIQIISTINPDMEPVRTSHHTANGVIYLGLSFAEGRRFPSDSWYQQYFK